MTTTVYNFSGGRTSAFMLWRVLQENGGSLPDDHEVHFQNTGKEMPQTLDFVRDCGENWGVDITWIEYDCPDPTERPSFKVVDYETASRNGEPFEQLITKRDYPPNAIERFCSSELKILTGKRYMVSRGYKKWRAAVGFRADEPSRAIQKQKDTRITPFYPLIEAGITKKDIYEFWVNSRFDLKLDNNNGTTPLGNNNGTTPLGNCDGCFLKSEKTKGFICREIPDSAEWWASMESKIGGVFRDNQAWADLIYFTSRQGNLDFNEDVGLYCNSSLGACSDW